jgi:hypothetical protein
LGHVFDALLRQAEAIDESRVLARGARGLHILGVRREQLRGVTSHRCRHGEEGAVFRLRVGAGELARGGAGAPAELEHVGLDVRRGVHG